MQTKLPVVFFGSDAIAFPLLENLLQADRDNDSPLRLEAIISQPDRRSGRGQQLQMNPVAQWAKDHGVLLLQPSHPNDELLGWVSAQQCQLALVMAYGHMLRRPLRDAFPLGMLNFHASILPSLRGASPVETAIAEGYTETGVSLMRIVARMDAGPVADIEKVTIDPDATGAQLRKKLATATAVLWQRNVELALKNELVFLPQDEGKASYCRKLTNEVGRLDFNKPVAVLYNQVRAYVDKPGCYFDANGQRIKVGAAEVLTSDCGTSPTSPPPGQIVAKDKYLDVVTRAGILRIKQLQKPGGRMLDAETFLRGFHFTTQILQDATP